MVFLLTLLAITARCSRTGALGRRGFALESALARVCREAGGRVATNLFVRNMDHGVPSAGDNKRLEVVVDGLHLFGGAQLAVDTTLVSALKGNGELRRGAADRDGVALAAACRVKERTGHVLWCSLLRLEKRPRSSSVCLPGHVSDPKLQRRLEEVERNHFMCRGEILCCVSVGPAGWSGV